MCARPVLLTVDWGSTSLRIALVDGSGATLEVRAAATGIRHVEEGKFEAAFLAAAADWLKFDLPILLSGMVTSRQGWIETSYVSCPAGLKDLAAGLVAHQIENGRLLYFVPGVMQQVPFHDVMRGEEVQIVGAVANEETLCILPGTHSKWIGVVDGRIARFATFLTGELYEVLRQKTLVGAAMDGDRYDPAWFERGVEYGFADPEETGGLLRQTFGVRSLGLLGAVPAQGLATYLSGLLIGTEIAGARKSLGSADSVTVIGAPDLVERYLRALALAGITAQQGPEDAAARGAFAIARQGGLIS